MMNAEKTCGNCEHVIRGDGITLHAEDMVCGNPDSDYASDFRFDDDTCICWEAAAKEGTE